MKTMQKEITLHFPSGDGLDVRIFDEACEQNYESPTLALKKEVEVIGSWIDGWDFAKVVKELCEKYSITEEQLFDIESHNEEMQCIIRDNQTANAYSMIRKRAQFTPENYISSNDYEVDLNFLDDEVNISDFEYNDKTERLEKVIRVELEYEEEDEDSIDFDDIIPDDYEVEWSELDDNLQWDYPVDCEEIFKEYSSMLNNIDIKQELREIKQELIDSKYKQIATLQEEIATLGSESM